MIRSYSTTQERYELSTELRLAAVRAISVLDAAENFQELALGACDCILTRLTGTVPNLFGLKLGGGYWVTFYWRDDDAWEVAIARRKR